jgi:hypothetical protein
LWHGNTGGAGGGGGEDERIEADATATNPRHVDEQIDEETYGGQPKVNNSAFASIGVDAVEDTHGADAGGGEGYIDLAGENPDDMYEVPDATPDYNVSQTATNLPGENPDDMYEVPDATPEEPNNATSAAEADGPINREESEAPPIPVKVTNQVIAVARRPPSINNDQNRVSVYGALPSLAANSP